MRTLPVRRLADRSLGVLQFPRSALEFWLRAEDVAVSPVATWPDISGNGNDFVQATGANQPTLVSDLVNGYPAVLFDGSNDYVGSTLDMAQPLTFAGVAMHTGGTTRAVIGSRNPASTGQPGAIVYIPPDNVYAMFAGSNFLSSVNPNVGWVCFVAVFNGVNTRFYINDEEFTGNPGARGAGQVLLGAFLSGGAPTGFWNGYIVEALGWSTALGQSDAQRVLDYFTAKYAL